MALNFEMTPSQAKAALIECIQAGLVPYLRSSPGLAKSSLAREIAEEYDLFMLDVRLSQQTPEDFLGVPFPNADRTRAEFLPFTIFPIEGTPLPINPKTGKPHEGWLLLLDEFSSANKGVQAASYKLVLDRMVNQAKLDPRVAIIAAGNLESDRAIVNPLSTAMQSRFIHIHMIPHIKDWINWALENGIDHRVVSFLEWKPDMLHVFDPDHEEATYACPRTWEFTSRLIKGKPDITGKRRLLAGTISGGPAIDFVSFTEIFDQIPKLDDILRDPDNAMFPTGLPQRFATIGSLIENSTIQNVKPILKYVKRFQEEEQVLYYRSTVRRHPKIRDVPEFGQGLMNVMRFVDGV